jgi:hypothetical protein
VVGFARAALTLSRSFWRVLLTKDVHSKVMLLAVGIFASAILLSASERGTAPSTGWQQSQKTDALRGTSYPQFTLVGKWLTPPRHEPELPPTIVVHCQPGQHPFGHHVNGKFVDGYWVANTVLDTQVNGGRTVTEVQFRLDDKKIQTEYWTPSTDFGGAFFSDVDLNNFLYGHLLPHKEGTNGSVQKIVVAANEYLAEQMVA